jgi:hypothetical protein
MIPATWAGRLGGSAYVLVVAAIATAGFATETTGAILLAGALSLPTSVPAAIGFYLAYGVLALVPGANPGTSSGSGSCTPDGPCQVSSTGDAAAWFVVATDAIGILALVVAALVNVAVASWLWRSVRGSASASARTRSAA